jgi:hypothetical protein
MRLQYVISTLSLLVCGCGSSGTDTPLTPPPNPADASALFLPVSAYASNGSLDSRSTGLFVFSSKSPEDLPKQITSQPVTSLGAHVQQTVDAQGVVSAGNPDQLFYATSNASGDNHVWLLDVTGTSRLVPKQLSSLTLPYFIEHLGPGVNEPIMFCSSQVIAKKLTDPASVLLFVSVPTSQFPYCTSDPVTTRWYLLHSSDGSATPPVNLPLLSSGILPLYSPEGVLAGLVAVDAAHNLNFYPDETLANPRVLLTNVSSITPRQERHSGLVASNPTYSFLEVRQTAGGSPGTIYRIDYTGAISGALYDFFGSSDGAVVESNTLFITEVHDNPGSFTELVVRIPGDGTGAQVLTTVYAQQGSWLPVLDGISGDNLVLSAGTPQQQWLVQTLKKSAPGELTTIGTYDGVAGVGIVGGDILVTAARITTSTALTYQWSTQVMDSAGTELQPLTPSSAFISSGTSVVQVRDIADTDGGLGGGRLFTLDLSQPSAPVSVALKTPGGAPISFPSGTPYVFFYHINPTLAVADNAGSGLIADLTHRTVVPVSIPNASISFLMTRELAN